jgi:hypothetical protein
MRHQGTLIIAALTGALAGACGEDFTVNEEPLSGTVGGESWTFAEGEIDFFLSSNSDYFVAKLFSEDYTPCGFDEPAGNFLFISIPREPGEYEFSTSLNMTFVIDSDEGLDNKVTFDGVIRVDEVTETSLSGGVASSFDGDNEINGLFELTICPDDGF